VRRVFGVTLAVCALAIIVFDLVTTTREASLRLEELEAALGSIAVPVEATRVGTDGHTATRRAIARSVFEIDAATDRILAHYRKALAAAGWSECGDRRTGNVYTGEVIRHHLWCRAPSESLSLSFEKVIDGRVRQYALTAEWNTRWWWIDIAGLALASLAIVSIQAAVRGQRPTGGRRHAASLWTGLSLDECCRRLETLRSRGVDGLILVRIEPPSGSAAQFELQQKRARWAANALAPYVYGTLRADHGGTQVRIELGFSPMAKITTVVIGIILAGGFVAQALVMRERAIASAESLFVVIVLTVFVTPLFWRRLKLRTVRVITRLLEGRATP
jgi:hypothetical protein